MSGTEFCLYEDRLKHVSFLDNTAVFEAFAIEKYSN